MVTSGIAVALRIACDQLDGVARDLSADAFATQQLRRQAEPLVSTSRSYLATSDPRSLQWFDATAAGLHSEQAEFDRASGGAHRLADTGRRDGPVVRFEVADPGPGTRSGACSIATGRADRRRAAASAAGSTSAVSGSLRSAATSAFGPDSAGNRRSGSRCRR